MLLLAGAEERMQREQEAIMVVRAELCDRLHTLQSYSARHAEREFAEAIVAIRRLAAAYGLFPVARLAEALERASREEPKGCCPTALYIDRLQDAIGCRRVDEEASQAMIASVSVRMS
jgi:hypothetical protein